MATEPLETRIARAIADSGIPWAGPGAACVDPETGEVWRRGEDGDDGYWTGAQIWREFDRPLEPLDDGTVAGPRSPALVRALAAGPDLDDACTVGGLLADMPDAELCQVRQSFNGNVADVVLGWWCGPRYEPTTEVPTRAIAVGAAWLEAHGLPVPEVGDE